MKLTIQHQDSYSRGQLLLRTFFGFLYILIPHGFCLFFVGIWSGILAFLAFWVVLFTGRYPKSWFDFQIKFMNWQIRVNSSMLHFVDGYPAFGLSTIADNVKLEVEYPEKLSRGLVLLRLFFGFLYVLIPHVFCLYFRWLATYILMFLAWWAVLFTGNYPENWHGFNVGSLRWALRINLYMGLFTDDYPPFSGKE